MQIEDKEYLQTNFIDSLILTFGAINVAVSDLVRCVRAIAIMPREWSL